MHTKDTGEPQPVQISNGTHMKESSRRSSSTSRMEEFMLRRHVRKSVHFQSTDGVLVLLQVASEALCDSEVWGNIRKSAALHALPISPLFSLQHRESIHKLAGSTRTIQRQLCKGDWVSHGFNTTFMRLLVSRWTTISIKQNWAAKKSHTYVTCDV